MKRVVWNLPVVGHIPELRSGRTKKFFQPGFALVAHAEEGWQARCALTVRKRGAHLFLESQADCQGVRRFVTESVPTMRRARQGNETLRWQHQD